MEEYSTLTSYETYIPRRFILEDGKVISLTADIIKNTLTKKPIFLLYVPNTKIDALYSYLKDIGFENAVLSTPKGEKYSIRLVLDYPWELHIRLYSDGFIESEVEVQREYFEHLGERRLFVAYEAFEFFRGFYDRFHLFYKKEEKWVIKVLDNFRVRLNPPKSLTPWKPVVTGIVTLSVVGLLVYALKRLSKR